MTPRQLIPQGLRDTGDLEEPPVTAGALLDRIPLPRELLRQCGAVERAHLTPRRNTGLEATATIRSSSRTAPVITTCVCSCGSGAAAPATPLAVVCR